MSNETLRLLLPRKKNKKNTGHISVERSGPSYTDGYECEKKKKIIEKKKNKNVLTNEFIIAYKYLSPINAVFIVNVCCSPAFILKKSIVSEPSTLLTAVALTGNSQKRKEWRTKRAKQTWRRLRNFYMASFISKFFQTAQSIEPKLFVSTASLNCLYSSNKSALYATFEFTIGFCV